MARPTTHRGVIEQAARPGEACRRHDLRAGSSDCPPHPGDLRRARCWRGATTRTCPRATAGRTRGPSPRSHSMMISVCSESGAGRGGAGPDQATGSGPGKGPTLQPGTPAFDRSAETARTSAGTRQQCTASHFDTITARTLEDLANCPTMHFCVRAQLWSDNSAEISSGARNPAVMWATSRSPHIAESAEFTRTALHNELKSCGPASE